MSRPFITVAVWQPGPRIKSCAFYIVTTHGTFRDVKKRRDMTPNGFARAISRHMASGLKVSFDVAMPPTFETVQRAEYQRTT